MADEEVPRYRTPLEIDTWGQLTIWWDEEPYELTYDDSGTPAYTARYTGPGRAALIVADNPWELDRLMRIDMADRKCGL